MTHRELTDEERAAFCEDVTRDRALDYFYVFDNVPLRHVYGDRLDPGKPTELEERNRAITETIWLESYHELLECNVVFGFTYRGSVLQMPLQAHRMGAGVFHAPDLELRPYRTLDGLRTDLEQWLAGEGAELAARLREQPAQASWQTLLTRPDRTARIVSLIPVDNQVLLELITTWTEDGQLKEAAWVVVLVYDTDGTVLQDRSYIEMANWPSGRRYTEAIAQAPEKLPDTAGVLDKFFDYQRSLQQEATNTAGERDNLSFVEDAWLDALNQGDISAVVHADRFRLQLPLQMRSCSAATARDLCGAMRAAAPDAEARLAMTYARGNQVVAEGIVSWHDGAASRESPFVSFLLLGVDGRVIRERRYLTLDNWPAASTLGERLAL